MSNILTLTVLVTAIGCGSVSASHNDAASNKCPATQILCGDLCIDPNSDLHFCGASGDCSGANAGMTCTGTNTCVSGTCQLSCPTGFVDCGGTCVDPSSNPKFCGASDTCTGASAGVNCASWDACVTGTCTPTQATCQHGAVTLSEPASGGIMICKDNTNVTCEQDFETLCPVGWHLCNNLEFYNRNDTWAFTSSIAALGEIYCRSTANNAGSFTVPAQLMSADTTFNCADGSSRATCVTGFGCNEQTTSALCCAPSPLCGDGVVDSPEEQCDDANTDETDDCLNSCTWRVPSAHAVAGCT